MEGLKRKLNNKLGSVASPVNWEMGELVAQWWRPDFAPLLFPYLPPHVTKPKECRKLFVVALPEHCMFLVDACPSFLTMPRLALTGVFAVPRNLRLLAVPLFELYNNESRYGPILSSIPHLLSRFQFQCVQ